MKNDKKRLFEIMSRVDKTFKPKLNEISTCATIPVQQEPESIPEPVQKTGFLDKIKNRFKEGVGEKYRAEVTGTREDVWSTNAMEYDTEEEAKEWLEGLAGRWFGFDMSRVVPTSVPKGQAVDMENDVIFQNFRR